MSVIAQSRHKYLIYISHVHIHDFKLKIVPSHRDLILTLDEPDFMLADVVMAGTFIPESMTAYDALAKLKENHEHCLIVCDEFGMMQGVLTLNDILDGLVGTVPESADAQFIIPRADNQGWLVAGQCPLYDFLDYFGCGCRSVITTAP